MFFEYIFKQEIQQMKLVFNKDLPDIDMKRNSKDIFKWNVEVELEPGIYLYKFAINSQIRLNDPFAHSYICESNGEVWSVIEINKDTRYENIGKKDIYFLDSALEICKPWKVSFDTKIICKAELHSVSIIWYQGNGQIIKFEEYVIYHELAGEQQFTLNFILDIINISLLHGVFKVIFFIDGEQVSTNYFSIQKTKKIRESYIDIAI